jgi:hypothetical protein
MVRRLLWRAKDALLAMTMDDEETACTARFAVVAKKRLLPQEQGTMLQ